MSFTKFTIKNYKCFKNKQSLFFSKPNNSLIGSGLTYIVGPNNSGKTTIIEALSIKDKEPINSSSLVNDIGPEFLLYEEKIIKKYCKLIRPTSFTIKEDPVLPTEETFEIISSRRHWSSNANASYRNIDDSLKESLKLKNRQNNVLVASSLKVIENDDDYKKFIKLVKRVIPEFTEFRVRFEENEYIEYKTRSGNKHKIDLLGDGTITVIRILLHLYNSSERPLIIDEPELSLHPEAQKRLSKIIAEYSKNRQIILSTHSPYFINWEYLKNGATLNRIVKTKDEKSSIFSILDFNKYDSLIKSANWQQPYLLDEVAKEIFFIEDNILFLEGQEDVGLLSKDRLIEKANFFGYGVRGKDNFEFALNLAKDLGYKKACCVLDKGKAEEQIKDKLETRFSGRPRYKIIQWNRRDIRDKKRCPEKSAKTGYFDKHGNIKTEDNLDDFKDKIREINRYFK